MSGNIKDPSEDKARMAADMAAISAGLMRARDLSIIRQIISRLYFLDRDLIPELTDEQWAAFQRDPARFFLRASDDAQLAIFNKIHPPQAVRLPVEGGE